MNEAAASEPAWRTFRSEITDVVRTEIPTRPGQLAIAELKELRGIHLLVYVAHRLRKAGLQLKEGVPEDLRISAERVLEMRNGRSPDPSHRRSRREEQYITTGRVCWHKLLKRLQVAADLRPGTRPELRPLLTAEGDAATIAGIVERHAVRSLEESAELVWRCIRDYPVNRIQLEQLRERITAAILVVMGATADGGGKNAAQGPTDASSEQARAGI